MKLFNLFDYWKQEEKSVLVIKILSGVIALIMTLCLIAFAGWMTAPSRLTVYIPPDISGGVFLKANEVPPQTVYAFTWQVFGSVNTWNTDGLTDYSTLIENYKNYFSPAFKDWLISDDKAKAQQNALDRKRYMTLVGLYDSSDVQVISAGVWQVKLNVEIVETVDNQVVKDVVMQYPLVVKRADLPITSNPWGLVLSGFAAQPTRIQTNV